MYAVNAFSILTMAWDKSRFCHYLRNYEPARDIVSMPVIPELEAESGAGGGEMKNSKPAGATKQKSVLKRIKKNSVCYLPRIIILTLYISCAFKCLRSKTGL